MIHRYIFQKLILLLVVSLLTGCASRAEPPTVNEISVQPGTTLMPGETAALIVDASGSDLKFEWSVRRGSLSNPTQPAVVYTAPDSTGPDVVTVRVTYRGGEIIRSVTLNVVEPPSPTVTMIPTAPNTPTPMPEPITCNSPAISKNLFFQLAEVNDQNSFYGPLEDSRYSCEAVYDIVHNQQLAVHIQYENVGENFGWWGVGTPKGYDATFYEEICFWAYAQKPNQSFRLKMKDTARKENGVIIILEPTNQWTEICTDLKKFADLGIKLKSLENVNLGFEQSTGSAEVWVADFEFK